MFSLNSQDFCLSFFSACQFQVSALYGLNGTGQGRGLLKWDYDGKKVMRNLVEQTSERNWFQI